MPEVVGHFEVTLPVAVSVAPELKTAALDPCEFTVDGSRASILPHEFTEAVHYEDIDEWELPKLVGLRVWITRSSNLEEDDQGRKVLSRDEEQAFEGILIEAVKRFVSVVKHQIGQWDLDTRHPVHSYNYRYLHADSSVNTSWPLSEGSKRMPEYALGMISFETYGEVTAEVWKSVNENVVTPMHAPPYEELLHDATTFRGSMRYDTAALFAGMAIELMLEAACKALLQKKGRLDDKQCDAILADRRMPSLISLVRRLDSSLAIDSKGIQKTFTLRNRIAHGKVLDVTSSEMTNALRTAHSLRRDLRTVLA